MRERDLEARRLSVDHKPNETEEAERVKARGGQVRNLNGCWRVAGPQGTNTLLAISRAFGDRELKTCTAQPLVSCVPAVSSHALSSQDRLLIMATDGLWDVVDDDAAVRIACEAARKTLSHPPPPGNDIAGGSAFAAAEALVRRATELRSLDNITVLVAWLLWDETAAAETPPSSAASVAL